MSFFRPPTLSIALSFTVTQNMTLSDNDPAPPPPLSFSQKSERHKAYLKATAFRKSLEAEWTKEGDDFSPKESPPYTSPPLSAFGIPASGLSLEEVDMPPPAAGGGANLPEVVPGMKRQVSFGNVSIKEIMRVSDLMLLSNPDASAAGGGIVEDPDDEPSVPKKAKTRHIVEVEEEDGSATPRA